MRFTYTKEDLAAGGETCWLLTNGLGGFMSTGADFSVTRCDQGVLVAAASPSRRSTLVHRIREELTAGGTRYALSAQGFADGTPPEPGLEHLTAFTWDGGPEWVYQAGDVRVTRRCGMAQGANTAAVTYRVENRGNDACTLRAAPVFQCTPKGEPPQAPAPVEFLPEGPNAGTVACRGLRVYVRANVPLIEEPTAWERLAYPDDEKDGRTPWGLGFSCCALALTVPAGESGILEVTFSDKPTTVTGGQAEAACRARQHDLMASAPFRSPEARELVRAADAFLAYRPSTDGGTIMAGYPFFGDWGRDTMIALPGCALAAGRYVEARSILRTFLAYERRGLLPNYFPEGGETPQYNSVDAPLLFINCVWLYYGRTGDGAFVREAWPVLRRIAEAYRTGTDYAIAMDDDGLIRAGSGLDQLTWMDVRIGDILPTPRHGKPVEINAYWYSALCILARLAPLAGEPGEVYQALAERVKAAFNEKFWIEDRGYLRDVLSGTAEETQLRCNQIWAVTMPFTMLSQDREQRVTEAVGRYLYTPRGLRTLSPEDPAFHPFYGGAQKERDLAYHQGTVWPFPLGAYYLAYLKVRGHTPQAAQQVRQMLKPMEEILREGCVGQIPEIYDGQDPGPSKGCFAQAWSVGELLRVYEKLEEIENKS